MVKDCVFCEIVRNKIPCSKVYEDDSVLAFNDVNPQAPVHVLIITKEHISGLIVVSEKDAAVLGHIQVVASKIAKQFSEMEDGFRLVNNCGANCGQTVFHIHYHLLGGRSFSWPPG
ncbi:MAG: histidine triad nucleotide-binding protein [Endomicrobium sp.]|nr:histidine triad nucleotide-binding protein [Endomicrobium sp.]